MHFDYAVEIRDYAKYLEKALDQGSNGLDRKTIDTMMQKYSKLANDENDALIKALVTRIHQSRIPAK